MNNPFEVIEAKLNNIEALLLDLKHNPQQSNQHEKDHWFDLKKLCIYLPDKPSKLTVYSWVRNNKIPFHKGAKKLIFLQSEIDTWMKEGRMSSSIGTPTPPENYLKLNKKIIK